MISRTKGLLLVAGAALLWACADDDVPASAPIFRDFLVALSPSEEVPAVTGVTSSGESRVRVRTERNLSTGALDTAAVLVETVVQNIDSVTAAHIHAGAPGVAGPIMVFLTPTYALVRGQRVARHLPDSATTLNGSLSYVAITRTSAFQAPYTYDSLLTRIHNGTAYVNVHTRRNAPGEIRGQID
jgi:hypothetical protein